MKSFSSFFHLPSRTRAESAQPRPSPVKLHATAAQPKATHAAPEYPASSPFAPRIDPGNNHNAGAHGGQHSRVGGSNRQDRATIKLARPAVPLASTVPADARSSSLSGTMRSVASSMGLARPKLSLRRSPRLSPAATANKPAIVKYQPTPPASTAAQEAPHPVAHAESHAPLAQWQEVAHAPLPTIHEHDEEMGDSDAPQLDNHPVAHHGAELGASLATIYEDLPLKMPAA